MKENGYVIAVYTTDDLLFQKILLDAPDGFKAVRGEAVGKNGAYLTLVDIDSSLAPACEHLTMSRKNDADIKIPFKLGTLKELVLNDYKEYISLSETDKCVTLKGARIKLTDVEFSLLRHLFEKAGEYASREEILQSVWKNDADSGVINVYIHYLREKLETGGEKIILSSRKLGYAIDKRFLNKSDTGRA